MEGTKTDRYRRAGQACKCGIPRQRFSTQLRRSRMPASPDFSGWNCVADSAPFSTAERNGSPYVVQVSRGSGNGGESDFELPLLRGVGVHEVETFIFDAAEQHAALIGRNGVPAHVRQYGSVELGHRARPLSEALGILTALDTVFEEHLHTDAHAEHGPPARKPAFDDLRSPPCSCRAERTAANAPTPGTSSPSASSASVRSPVRVASAPAAISAFTAEWTLPEP